MRFFTLQDLQDMRNRRRANFNRIMSVNPHLAGSAVSERPQLCCRAQQSTQPFVCSVCGFHPKALPARLPDHT